MMRRRSTKPRHLPFNHGAKQSARRLLLVLSVLLLGCGTSMRATAGPEWLYVAQKGDTLWDLCLQHTVKRLCWIELQSYNEIKNDRRIPIGTVIRVPATWLKEVPLVGGIIQAEGDASFREMDNAQYSALAVDQALYLGDSVRTVQGGAMLELVSGLLVVLRPNSELQLNSFSDDGDYPLVELVLDHGSMEVAVIEYEETGGANGDFQVLTDAASAQIAGTARISTEADGSSTRGEALRGAMNVASGGTRVAVPEGYGVRAAAGSAPSTPKELPPLPVFETGSGNAFEPALIGWASSERSRAWQLDVLESPKGTRLLHTYRVEQPQMRLDDLGPGCYVLALRAIDEEGYQGAEQRAPLCVYPRLEAPQFQLVHRVEGNKRLDLIWNGVQHASSYRLEMAADAEFSQRLESWSLESTVTQVPLDRKAAAYVRVRAINEVAMEGPNGDTFYVEPLSSKAGYIVAGEALLMLILGL